MCAWALIVWIRNKLGDGKFSSCIILLLDYARREKVNCSSFHGVQSNAAFSIAAVKRKK